MTAQRPGQAERFSGQSRHWSETEQHDALLISACNRTGSVPSKNDRADPDCLSLVLGLPASYCAQQRDTLRTRANQLLQPRIKPNQQLRVYIESQSAALLYVAFDTEGGETGRAGDDESWGVVEIGQFTTDFTVHDRGQQVNSAATSVRGTQMVYERIASIFK